MGFIVENVNNITVAGGTRIAIGAIAYSGSSVSASINGQIVNLKEIASGYNGSQAGTEVSFGPTGNGIGLAVRF